LSTFHESLDNLQQQYTKLGNILSAETYRADTAEGEAFATNLRLIEVLKELESIKALYRGSPSDLRNYIKMTNEECSRIAKEIGNL